MQCQANWNSITLIDSFLTGAGSYNIASILLMQREVYYE
jgi:hypothetical protein